ncbi:MAG: thioredoxin domain-containing protein [Gammaproteobacteria bacterium]|nr:thioredoxin domain-containing protein [Gammaproteobacteria bacterium]
MGDRNAGLFLPKSNAILPNQQSNPMSDSTIVSPIFSVDYENFQHEVIDASHQRPILVDLWADWCGPCLVIAPILKQLIEAYDGELLLAKVELDEGKNMKLAGQYQVRGFPTLILFQNGAEQGRFHGAKPRHFIEAFIQQHAQF